MKFTPLSKNAMIVLPVVAFFGMAALELGLWPFRPWGWFHPRGFDAPNLSYQSTIYGDYINNATDIDPATGEFVARPVYRAATIKTDAYGERNDRAPAKAFAVMIGDSMAGGDGNSHEDIPTRQLSTILGREVILPFVPRGYDRFARAAMFLVHQRPTAAGVLVFLIHDQWFMEPLSNLSPIEQIEEVIRQDRYGPRVPRALARFGDFKVELRDWSGNAILARKAKTSLKKAMIRGLALTGIYDHKTGLDYIASKSGPIIVEPLPPDVGEIGPGHAKFDRQLAGTIRLAKLAGQKGVLFLPVLIPAKEYPYNAFRKAPAPLRGYGPAAAFNAALIRSGLETVFAHPALFAAVERQMRAGGPAVYWNDDGHWSPYGIKLTMELVRGKLASLGALK